MTSEHNLPLSDGNWGSNPDEKEIMFPDQKMKKDEASL